MFHSVALHCILHGLVNLMACYIDKVAACANKVQSDTDEDFMLGLTHGWGQTLYNYDLLSVSPLRYAINS